MCRDGVELLDVARGHGDRLPAERRRARHAVCVVLPVRGRLAGVNGKRDVAGLAVRGREARRCQRCVQSRLRRVGNRLLRAAGAAAEFVADERRDDAGAGEQRADHVHPDDERQRGGSSDQQRPVGAGELPCERLEPRQHAHPRSDEATGLRPRNERGCGTPVVAGTEADAGVIVEPGGSPSCAMSVVQPGTGWSRIDGNSCCCGGCHLERAQDWEPLVVHHTVAAMATAITTASTATTIGQRQRQIGRSDSLLTARPSMTCSGGRD